MSSAQAATAVSDALRVAGLRVETDAGLEIVAGVSLSVAPGEVLAVVGESGCGKTTIAKAVLGYARSGSRIAAGEVWVDGVDLLALDRRALREVRRRSVSYVPQDPQRSLSPRRRIGQQLNDSLPSRLMDDAAATRRISELLERVGLPSSPEFLRRYPFQLSGGQQQRVLIAMALLCRPGVVVLDEPTTGLDVITQAGVIELLQDVVEQDGVAMVYITHDLAVVDGLADRVAVVYGGRVVEQGPARAALGGPLHPYTSMLVGSVPRLRTRLELVTIPGVAPAVGERPTGCSFHPRCRRSTEICGADEPMLSEAGESRAVACHHPVDESKSPIVRAPQREDERGDLVLDVEDLVASHGTERHRVPVLHGLSLQLRRGECVALVGESGSGKTTAGRCLVGLHVPDAGRVTLAGELLPGALEGRSKKQLSRLQMVFQNPSASLNPSHTIGRTLGRAITAFDDLSAAGLEDRVRELLLRVHLDPSVRHRFPRDLSGGEQQRVAIARALATRPEALVCDEITSALDVSIQAAILELMTDLLEDGIAILFITHNLAVVNTLAHRTVVLRNGEIVESGATSAVIGRPRDEYTRRLLAAAPEIEGSADVRPDPAVSGSVDGDRR